MNQSELVETYIKLRDKKAEIKAEYDAKVQRIEEGLAKIEAKFLEHFNASNTDSLSIRGVGTAFRQLKTTASVADREAFLDFVKNEGAWEMLENRVSKKAVEEYRNEHDDLPPGINWTARYEVNIRRN